MAGDTGGGAEPVEEVDPAGGRAVHAPVAEPLRTGVITDIEQLAIDRAAVDAVVTRVNALEGDHLQSRAVVTIELSLPLGSRQQMHDDLQMAQSDEFMDDLCARFGFGRVVASQEEIEEAATEQAANSSTDWWAGT